MKIAKEYLVSEKGRKKAVVLPYSAWKKIVNELEELEDIRAYDEAKRHSSDPVSFTEAIKTLKRNS